MRRLLRHLFSLAAVASAALCAGVCGLWVRSDRTTDMWYCPFGDGRGGYAGEATLWSQRGELRLGAFRLDAAAPAAAPEGRAALAAGVRHTAWDRSWRVWTGVPPAAVTAERAGFGWGRSRGDLWVPAGGWTPWPQFDATAAGTTHGGSATVVFVPDWALFAAAAALPAVWVGGLRRRLRRRRRAERGLCRACGYDLRATPGRCPECGAVPSAPAAGKGAAWAG